MVDVPCRYKHEISSKNKIGERIRHGSVRDCCDSMNGLYVRLIKCHSYQNPCYYPATMMKYTGLNESEK